MRAFLALRPFRLIALLVFGAALVGATGCVSLDEHKRLQNAFEQSQQQLAEAENDLANARKQIEGLNARIAELQRLIELLKAGGEGKDKLLAEIARLKDEVARLTELAGGIQLPASINKALQDLVAKYPDLLEYDANLGMIRFKSDMTFDLGSTEVKARAKEALKILAGILNDPLIANNEVRVVGHTDDVPIRLSTAMTMNPTNWFLSTNRAHAVRQVLQGDEVAAYRLQAAGWGETHPIAPNAAGHKGNELNRRVEIYILPTVVKLDKVILPGVERTPGTPVAPVRRPPTRTTPATPRTPATTTPGVPIPVPAG